MRKYIFIVITMLVSYLSFGEIFVLENGDIIRGAIISSEEDNIIIKSSLGVLTISKEKIKKIYLTEDQLKEDMNIKKEIKTKDNIEDQLENDSKEIKEKIITLNKEEKDKDSLKAKSIEEDDDEEIADKEENIQDNKDKNYTKKEEKKKYFDFDDPKLHPLYISYKRFNGAGIGLVVPGSIMLGVSALSLIPILSYKILYSYNYYYYDYFSDFWIGFFATMGTIGLIMDFVSFGLFAKANKYLKQWQAQYEMGLILDTDFNSNTRLGVRFRF
ncbi:MAG: hypothetical protein A2086_01935 [Spirochaetes bacterium GWD1_27_9]|nr:MAG: hypothetical protein A2Z98_16700 [Spirochaetes bacterium GWB1_27_13]OHD24175.1 MAG: hypothetical protein A2Y34_18530 [Spirochaetes bacterium GWC1_27_15]OHD41621.1 MAG: hypothetical protein A2086_01935 [Spirochaetes bacterium GWD1_27_9]